jgi:3',5'-cyclic AMP phosphodiesterase CpdA
MKSMKLLLRSIAETEYDHLIITGDIVSTADPDDFYCARELFGSFGLLHPDRLTVVPGNHDIFGGPHRATDVPGFPRHISTIDYLHNLTLFEDAFAETFVGVRRPASGQLYPFVKTLGDIQIIGLNSIPPWSLWDNPLGSNGLVDDDQCSALEALSRDTTAVMHRRIVAMHHHFGTVVDETAQNSVWKKIESRTMRLRKRRRLLRHFDSLNVKCILHGHIHKSLIYEKDGMTFANGAGSVCDDPVRYLKYNKLTIDQFGIQISIVRLPHPYQLPMAAIPRYRTRARSSLPQFASQGA